MWAVSRNILFQVRSVFCFEPARNSIKNGTGFLPVPFNRLLREPHPVEQVILDNKLMIYRRSDMQEQQADNSKPPKLMKGAIKESDFAE